MTPDGFDDLIHAPLRLTLCATLYHVEELEFSALTEGLEISESTLSKHAKALSDAGYLLIHKRKQLVGRPRTWLELTIQGRIAYTGHVKALRDLTDGVDLSAAPS
ncbi:MAG: transcriptional regulator [Brachybacterium sp.]|nr:transcriptional regulator [Brachybacterium sp.]